MIRVLVIDDSAYNRQTLTSILESVPGIQVIARAGDGDEGLRLVFEHAPDIVTLDLEMPRMDGYTFLRILMARRPTPVIVISSHAERENVFKALELGALDFITKPTRKVSQELHTIGAGLIEKIRLIGQLRMVPLDGRTRRGPPTTAPTPALPADPAPAAPQPPRRVVVIGASTGGPAALTTLFGALQIPAPIAFVIAQHMPPKFTQAFAERLDRLSPFTVREARSGDLLRAGLVLVAPGGAMTTVRRSPGGLRVFVEPALPEDRFVPSIDRLFESAAEAVGTDVVGIILTGMVGEGVRGSKAVAARGGCVLAEAKETAVMAGMPEEVARAGQVTEVVPLGAMAAALLRRVKTPG